MGNKLRDPRRELFCQMIVAGCPKDEAYQKAGYKGQTSQSINLLFNKPEVRKRIDELMGNLASRAEISRKQILERIYEDWETCRRLGQMSSALKAAELMGKELHKMFVERKEVGGPGDFDSKSEEELKQIVEDGLRELGWDNQKTLN
jgi:phage terminase small subunit